MKAEIKIIDNALLEAILKGGKIICHKSRASDDNKRVSHVAIVEMPKDVLFGIDKRYWKYLVFLSTPNMNGWWHASSNNLNKTANHKKMWDEWSEFKTILNHS